jgi:ArsR family transcriptional regulator, lead/cadmium/zinc/bismuth-responsive transcriptional repressor
MAISCIRLLADPIKIKTCRDLLTAKAKVLDHQADRLELAGNPVRLRILYLLSIEPELCPCDLSDILRMTVQAVSQHLKKLKDAGWVTTRKENVTVYYSLSEPALVHDLLGERLQTTTP